MSNSGHAFSFTKAVVLQAITKYKSIVDRSNLEVTDRKYIPLYRDREYNKTERALLKYIEPNIWYKGFNLGDPFRSDWKRRLNRKKENFSKKMFKGRRINNSGAGSMPDISTTFFVPPSEGSLLTELVLEAEDQIKGDIPWGVKIVEQSGQPLSLSFLRRFPVIQGCPRGNACPVCDNDCVKCAAKGVVYKAVCTACGDREIEQHHDKVNSTSDETRFALSSGEASIKKMPDAACYIGETSRPIRERALEHEKNKAGWRMESFQIAHWMDCHPLETTCPTFKYEIISQYKDPLRRQLNEAINILNKGILNRKMEFGRNELCRLEPAKSDYDKENLFQAELRERKVFKNKMDNFIKVMSSVEQIKDSDNTSTIRHLTDIYDSRFEGKAKKPRMDCSTPAFSRREHPPAPGMEESPIEKIGEEVDSRSMEESGGDGKSLMCRTNISNETDKLLITPPTSETSSMENRRLFITAMNWSDAASKKGIKSRAHSEPRNMLRLSENAVYKDFPTRADDLKKSPTRGRSNSFVNCERDNNRNSLEVDAIQKLRDDVEKLNILPVAESSMKLKISPIKIPTVDGISDLTLGLKSMKRRLVSSPENEMECIRKVSIGEGSSPILKLGIGRERDGRSRAHTVGSPFVRTKHKLVQKQLCPDTRGRTSSCDNNYNQPVVKRRKATPKLRLAARFDYKEDVSGGIASSSRKKQALISNMFPSTPVLDRRNENENV